MQKLRKTIGIAKVFAMTILNNAKIDSTEILQIMVHLRFYFAKLAKSHILKYRVVIFTLLFVAGRDVVQSCLFHT